MKAPLITLIAVISTLCLMAAYVEGRLPWKPDGVIAIDGYEHAAIVCGEGMYINHGHYTDTEVFDLVLKAKEECK